MSSFQIRSFEMVALVCNLLGILLLIFVMNEFQPVDGVEIYLQQVDVKSPKRVAGMYNIELMRVIKFNRTAYGLNLNIELETDLDDAYSVRMISFYLISR